MTTRSPPVDRLRRLAYDKRVDDGLASGRTDGEDFPSVVVKTMNLRSKSFMPPVNLLTAEGTQDATSVDEVETVVGLLRPEGGGQELSQSGSFCTEVRNLHLAPAGITSSPVGRSGQGVSGADPGSEVDIESISDDSGELSSDDEPRPPPEKTQKTSLSPSLDVKDAGEVRSNERKPLVAFNFADLTPEELERRIQLFEESRENNRSGPVNLTPLARFRRAATQVKMLCAVQISLDKHIREAGRSVFGGGLPDLMANMANTPSVVFTSDNQEKISFNASDFKCQYEFTWPKKAKMAIEKAPEDRTEDDIRLISGLMRGLSSFRKYTKKHQDLICRVVRLQKYGRRRVIVRKGHIGYSFYFVFSGAACATLDEDEETAFVRKEVTVLRKGAAFGEIALLKDVRRKATIVCLTDTELLVVDRDDFFDNGLDRHITQEFEYRLNFFQKLDLFSTWSDHCLEEVSDMGRVEEHNHDSVLVKDSTENEWLLFICKGRCDVLKFVDLAKLCHAEDEDSDSKSGRRSRGSSAPGRDTHGTQSSIMQMGDCPLSLLPNGHQQNIDQQSPMPWMPRMRPTTRPKTTGQITRKSREAEEHQSKLHTGRSKSATVRLREEPEIIGDSSPPSLYSRGSPTPMPCHTRGSSEPGIPSELRSELSMGISTMRGPGVQAGVYVKVDTLGPGECFGLETAVNGSMAKFSLLSQGCEIIRVSMSKFREYADKVTLKKAQHMFTTCPSDYALWTSFKKQNHWNNFKNGVVTDVMYEAHVHNSQNKTGCQPGGGIVSRDVSTAGSRRAVEMSRRKTSDYLPPASNPFPKISFAAGAWADNRSSSRRSGTTSNARSAQSRQTSNYSRTTTYSGRLNRVISSAYSTGSRRSVVSRSVSPQRVSVFNRLYSAPSRPRVPTQIHNVTRPTYTGSLSWKQYGKS